MDIVRGETETEATEVPRGRAGFLARSVPLERRAWGPGISRGKGLQAADVLGRLGRVIWSWGLLVPGSLVKRAVDD